MTKVLWIIGNSGAGKTSLAREAIKMYGGISLDGDDMRTCWKLGFGEDNRYENNLRIARIAKVLSMQGFDVVVSTICPYRALRAMISEIIHHLSILYHLFPIMILI